MVLKQISWYLTQVQQSEAWWLLECLYTCATLFCYENEEHNTCRYLSLVL